MSQGGVKGKIGMVSLGCPRNLVDSEVMLGLLKAKGYSISERIEESDVAIVNTCAFIKDAADESIDTILSLIDLKKKGRIKSILVAGCLVQRFNKNLKKGFKEIDGFIGTGDIKKIGSVVTGILCNKKRFVVSKKPKYIYDDLTPRDFITPSHYAYIKIQEGCANKCSYCLIPKLRGPLRSRPINSILKEFSHLTEKKPISELNIIGQDTTYYGYDLYRKASIAGLLKSLSRQKKVQWIRLLYTHPAHYTDELIEVIKSEESICKYLDLPIQHISDKILKRMRRITSESSIRALIETLRKKIPGLAIRTTLLTGFPGETDRDFCKLLDFIKEIKFERLGVFMYSNEEGITSYRMKPQVPEKVKNARMDEIMKAQQEISVDYNKSFMGKTIEVLIDEVNMPPSSKEEAPTCIGRTQYDAPSVDGQVYINAKGLKPGDFIKARIKDTLEYDLVGESI